jgi:hypothetical protein
MNMSPQQLGQATGVGQHGQTTPNWLGQGGPSPANAFPNSQLPNTVQMPSNTPVLQNTQVNNSPAALQSQGLMPQHPPPRSGPTPLQHPNLPPNSIRNSPNISTSLATPVSANQTPQSSIANGTLPVPPQGPSQPQQRQPQQQPRQLPALPKDAFDAAYREWCRKQNITEDPNDLDIGGQRIELHRLHQEVIAAGTVHKVNT